MWKNLFKELTNGNNVGMISNVTFVNKFVTIVKMFLITTGTKNGGYL